MADILSGMPDESGSDLDRPVWGAVAISRLINRSARQTFHLLETGELPARKVGGRWVTTQRRLHEVFDGVAPINNEPAAADERQPPTIQGKACRR
jgi:hypothetical protein